MFEIKMYYDDAGEEEYNVIKENVLWAIFFNIEDAQEYCDWKNGVLDEV